MRIAVRIIRIFIVALALIPTLATTVFSANLTVTPALLASYAGQANILLQATGNITVSASTTLDLSGSTGQTGGTLTLQAGGDIIFNTDSLLTDANNWSVNLLAGSTQYSITSTGPRGIYSGALGDISVVAGGDVIVNGSRVAAYDGGNIAVNSLNGNVNTGDGGIGFVVVNSFKVDPITHQVTTFSPTIPGSGILATTFTTDASQTVGNISLTGQNISLGCGAITQTPLNGTSGSASTTTLQAAGNIYMYNGGSTAVLSSGSVNCTAGGTITSVNVALQAQVNVTNLTAAAGINVQFTVTAQGTPPFNNYQWFNFNYQWFKNTAPLLNETNASLLLTNIHRTDAGTYSVVVSNIAGTVTNNIQLHVQVPQLLNIAFDPTSTIFSVSFGDADGGILTSQDISTFVVQSSTNLLDWTTVSSSVTTNGSGGLSFQVSPSSNLTQCFWRILSQ